jgi:hypothetical protein
MRVYESCGTARAQRANKHEPCLAEPRASSTTHFMGVSPRACSCRSPSPGGGGSSTVGLLSDGLALSSDTPETFSGMEKPPPATFRLRSVLAASQLSAEQESDTDACQPSREQEKHRDPTNDWLPAAADFRFLVTSGRERPRPPSQPTGRPQGGDPSPAVRECRRNDEG